ncbi:DUF485 domain-containing protein [Pseudomonas entomophila]|uniref:DUF485 domain-containing protein n=1 Tax=Pseudomonas entomophila TaxID=312306 RepID=UPI0023D8A129|nr:DUF485 domain-containing protein [Pseudomonas entomophila]MDF0733188.1 DUF485 domain-containing protein [Pseudomonas entomophila]
MNHALASPRVPESSAYRRLVALQRSVVTRLTCALLIPYCAFILIAAFAPDLLASKVLPTSVINIAWPLGAVFIVGAWVLTGIYILRANRAFDALANAVREENPA